MYATLFRSHCETCKSNFQLKGKHPQTVMWTPAPPKAVVSITFPSWNAMFLSRQTRTRQSMERNKYRLSSDQWIRFQLRIIQRRWSCDQFHRAYQWCNYSCGRFCCCCCCCFPVHRHCSLSRLLTVLTDTWPPTFQFISITSWCSKRSLLEHRAMSLHSLGVVLRVLQYHRRSTATNIRVTCKRSTRRSITDWCVPICPLTFLLVKPSKTCQQLVTSLLKSIVAYTDNLAMKTLYAKNSTNSTWTF